MLYNVKQNWNFPREGRGEISRQKDPLGEGHRYFLEQPNPLGDIAQRILTSGVDCLLR